ncbi:MAG: hypothetical protein EB829_04630 [Nitrosopumilus sp. H8]|nr:MAG: hypothetical protein EB829_04630 [Nitrosopumilus sp. H8]
MIRLGGDEMGITKTQQASMNYLLNVQKVKTKDGGRIRRKASSLTEVIAESSGPRLCELFRYDPGSESFEPNGIEDVMNNSRCLDYATRFLGIPDVAEDMQRRIVLLQECVDKKAYGIDQIFGIISKYYQAGVP